MKITEDVRAYARHLEVVPEQAIERGMKEKSEEFRKSGAEVYREV
jgi:phosphomethylpyrimidine synthase